MSLILHLPASITMPIATWQAIVGKFLAGLAVIAAAIACSFPIVITVSYLGDPDNGAVWAGYIATLCYGAACLAITCAVSALTRSMVACLIISVTLCFLFLLAAIPPVQSWIIDTFGGGFAQVVASFSMLSHFNDMKRGVIGLENVTYFLSVIIFSLFVTSVAIRTKRS